MSICRHACYTVGVVIGFAGQLASALTLTEEPVVASSVDASPFSQIVVVDRAAYQLAQNDADDERTLTFPGQQTNDAGTINAQDSEASNPGPSVDLTLDDWGISLGDSKGVNGLRLNYRDSRLEWVNGVNVTVWRPHRGRVSGSVTGLALGLPSTAAADITGIGLSGFAAHTTGEFRGIGLTGGALVADGGFTGIGIAPVALVSKGDITGLAVSGIGVSSDQNFLGIGVAGIGFSTDRDFKGIGISGIGLSADGDMGGLAIGGIGTASDGDMTGIGIGGIGVSSDRTIRGITLGGIGVSADQGLTGLAIGGIGVSGGKYLTGIGIGGVGVGADKVRGITAGLFVNSRDYFGVSAAPLRFTIERDGNFRGLSVSAWNNIRGANNGVTIGLLNYARQANGIQLGLINIVRDNPPGLRVLPVFNRSF